MEFNFFSKNVLVVGAGHGIGSSISDGFIKEGASVCGVARSDIGFLQSHRTKLWQSEKNFYVVKDLIPDVAPSELVEILHQRDFHPDIVIYSLGGFKNNVNSFSLDYWRKMYRLNIEISLQLNDLLLRHMISQKWGRIIYISSIAGMESRGPIAYCTLKAALSAYVRSMGCRLASTGVIFSSLLPGAVESPENLRKDIKDTQDFFTSHQKLGRFIELQEISNFVFFLCSDLVRCHTGSIIPIDGGLGRGYFGQ